MQTATMVVATCSNVKFGRNEESSNMCSGESGKEFCS